MEILCFKTDNLRLDTCKFIWPNKTSGFISADVLRRLSQTVSSSPATWSTTIEVGGTPHPSSWHGLLSFWSLSLFSYVLKTHTFFFINDSCNTCIENETKIFIFYNYSNFLTVEKYKCNAAVHSFIPQIFCLKTKI